MDVVIENSKVKIVEFNSFGSGISGASLYNWKRDKFILYSQNEIPDIRVNR